MKKHRHSAGDYTGRLREGSCKMTGQRRAVIEALERKEHPQTIREIHDAVGAACCDLATIYRSMRMLERVGLVKRFDFGDGCARFELIHLDEDGHHHHLVCTSCSKVVEIEECFPAELERRIADGNGFSSVSHRLEFFGICPECQRR